MLAAVAVSVGFGFVGLAVVELCKQFVAFAALEIAVEVGFVVVVAVGVVGAG